MSKKTEMERDQSETGIHVSGLRDASTDERPENCRDRLQDEGKPYPKSGCEACGWTPFNDEECMGTLKESE